MTHNSRHDSTATAPDEALNAGCPMLVKSAATHPIWIGKIFMRCSLGWSIRDDLDIARCSATSAVNRCWREHPEFTPLISVQDDALVGAGLITPLAAD